MHVDLIVYTIGHSNGSEKKIIDLLETNNIDKVVDVRSVPYSKHAPQFNKDLFKNVLKHHNIQYIYEGDFLGMRLRSAQYFKNGVVSQNKHNYLKDIDLNKAAQRPEYCIGIQQLIDHAKKNKVAIMCSEENPNKCHRHHLISQTLLDQGIKVIHIRGDGHLVEAQRELVQLAF